MGFSSARLKPDQEGQPDYCLTVAKMISRVFHEVLEAFSSTGN